MADSAVQASELAAAIQKLGRAFGVSGASDGSPSSAADSPRASIAVPGTTRVSEIVQLLESLQGSSAAPDPTGSRDATTTAAAARDWDIAVEQTPAPHLAVTGQPASAAQPDVGQPSLSPSPASRVPGADSATAAQTDMLRAMAQQVGPAPAAAGRAAADMLRQQPAVPRPHLSTAEPERSSAAVPSEASPGSPSSMSSASEGVSGRVPSSNAAEILGLISQLQSLNERPVQGAEAQPPASIDGQSQLTAAAQTTGTILEQRGTSSHMAQATTSQVKFLLSLMMH